jgi:bifunctional non-homologous end joining protein LigD
VWNSRADKLDRPDRVVFDLDPTVEDFAVVREAALTVADVLRELGVEPFAMVSGSRGIHVYAPLKRTRTADEIRAAAQTIAERVVERRPDTLTTAWHKEKREGKILVDVARNTYGQTVVAPYAVRALPGAPVATPVSWDEVADAALHPQGFKLRELGERLRRAGDPWAEMESSAATLPRDLF